MAKRDLATRDANAPANKLIVEGFVTLDISGTPYTLSGKFSKPTGIVFAYHKPFEEALRIGSIDTIITEVGTKLVGADDAAGFKDKWDSAKEVMAATPLVGEISDKIIAAQICITDLGINTKIGEYQFGFAFDLRDDPLGLGPIEIQAFGVKLTYTKPQPAP
jgi:hypothetical protein